LEAALMALHPALYAPVLTKLGATLTIYADDDLCPANTRPLHIPPHGVCFTEDMPGPWLRADIRTLARLYLGDLLPTEAEVSADSPQTLRLADRLFPRREPYVASLDQF